MSPAATAAWPSHRFRRVPGTGGHGAGHAHAARTASCCGAIEGLPWRRRVRQPPRRRRTAARHLLSGYSTNRRYAMDDTRLTRHGIAGSTGYMAPELFEGAVPSPAADVGSLGTTLFPPHRGTRPLRPTDPGRHPARAPQRRPAAAELPSSSLHTHHRPPHPYTDHRMTSQQAVALLRSTATAAPPTAALTSPARVGGKITMRPPGHQPRHRIHSRRQQPTRSGDNAWANPPTTVSPVFNVSDHRGFITVGRAAFGYPPPPGPRAHHMGQA